MDKLRSCICPHSSGPAGLEEFVHSLFGVVESLAQHPTLLEEYQQLLLDRILPPLATLVSSPNGE